MKNLIKLAFLLPFVLLSTACGGPDKSGGSSSGPSGQTQSQLGTTYSAVTDNTNGSGYVEATTISTSGTANSSSSTTSGLGLYPKGIASAVVGGAEYLYVAALGSNQLDEFKVSGTTVTPIGTVATGPAPQVVIVVGNAYVYVSDTNNGNTGAGDIYSYQISSNGTLTPVGAPAYNAVNPVYGLATDAKGSYLVAAVATSSAWNAVALSVSNGNLTKSGEVTGLPGSVPFVWVADPSTTNGDFLYGGQWDGSYVYEVTLKGGTISVQTMSGMFNHLDTPVWVDPTGTWAYVMDFNSSSGEETIIQYQIGSSGSLTSVGSPVLLSQSNGGSTQNAGVYLAGTVNGTLIVPFGGYAGVLGYTGLSGTLTVAGLGSGLNGGGVMAFAN